MNHLWTRRQATSAIAGFGGSLMLSHKLYGSAQASTDVGKNRHRSTIDAHVHPINPVLPGIKTLPDVLGYSPQAIAQHLQTDMQAAGVTEILAMGRFSSDLNDPFGIAHVLQVAHYLPGLSVVGAANPTRIDNDFLQRCEAQLKQGKIVAMKGYLGYLHFGPDSTSYIPYYELAARYKIPFIFHTGDTYSTTAKVKYAHPLLVDEVAVEHPEVNFVLAHFGNPWLADAAEVIYKNDNVWADLSGILVGNPEYFQTMQKRGVIEQIVARFRPALEYAGKPDRFLFGSDWPLAPIAVYQDFIAQLIPEEYWPQVFETNARTLFKLINRA